MTNKSDSLFKNILRPTVVMVSICIIVTLALSITNNITSPKISALNEKQQKDSMSKLIKADSYDEATLDTDGNSVTYYRAMLSGAPVGYIFITSSGGYGGDVSVMTATDTSGKVTSVAILDVSNETPGLGQNAAREDFYSQFIGKNSAVSAAKHGTASGENEIDAVTGATITSKAVTNAVNTAIGYAEKITEISEMLSDVYDTSETEATQIEEQ